MTNRHRAGRFAVLALVMLVAVLAAVPDVAHAAASLVTGSHAWPALGALALATAPMAVPANGASPFDGLIPSELAGRAKRTYMAPLEWLNLAAGAANSAQFVADANHDFCVTALRYVARDAAGAIVVAPLLLTDWSLVNGTLFTPNLKPVELEAIAGSNRGSQELLIPLVVPAGETLDVQLRNGTAAVVNVRVTLIGFRTERARR